MTFTVTIVDAPHRPTVFAEIELDGELFAEAHAEAGRMRLTFVDASGSLLREAPADGLGEAIDRARAALVEAGLLGCRKAPWYLEAYSNRDDELVSEHLLVGVTTDEVRAITGMPSYDPMYHVYPLPDSHVEWAERAAGVELDLERNAYLLSGRFERPSGKP